MTTRTASVDQILRATDRPVFVGGCPRSGTTLLSAMLSAHPAFAIPPETRFFIESYRARRRFGDLRERKNREAFGHWLTTTDATRFPLLQLPAEQVIAAVADAPPTIGSLSGAVFREFAATHGGQRWGDKRPQYIEFLPQVFRLAPDAQFVHIVRDARGCSASLAQLGWWGWGVPQALHKWRLSVTAGLRARSQYREDQYIEVRYEDLVNEPEPELRRLCAFLKVDYDSAMLAHQSGATLINQPYHQRLSQPLDPSAAESWRERLGPGELAFVEAIAGDLLDVFGYPRVATGHDVPPDLVRAYRLWTARRRAVEDLDRARDAVRTGRRVDVAARLTSAQRALAGEV